MLDTLKAELADRLVSEPGVIGHTFTNDLPGTGSEEEITFENDGEAAVGRTVSESAVDDVFFKMFGVELLAGLCIRRRGLGRKRVRRGRRPIVRSLTRAASGGAVLGRRIRYVPEGPDTDSAPVRWHRIVGVVENIDENPLSRKLVDARVYHPLKAGRLCVGLAVRVGGTDLGAFGRRVEKWPSVFNPALEVDVEPLRQYYRFGACSTRNAAIGLGATLLSVLLLAAAGIYALMSFTVARRRHEIAIRTALGAQPGRLLGGIFRQALWQISLGIAVGVAVALFIDYQAGGEALRGRDWLLLTGTSVRMGLVGLFAAWGPARRGLKIEPLEALRGE